VTIEMSSATTIPVTERRLGMSMSLPISAAATMFHTPPGRYLPTWETKNSLEAGAMPRWEPRSRRTARHESIVAAT
jgi:hypothetical protein